MKKKKRRMGRPPKKHGLKDARLVVKMPQSMKDRFERAADAAKAEDVSAWVRSVLDAEARRVLSDPMARPTEDTWEP